MNNVSRIPQTMRVRNDITHSLTRSLTTRSYDEFCKIIRERAIPPERMIAAFLSEMRDEMGRIERQDARMFRYMGFLILDDKVILQSIPMNSDDGIGISIKIPSVKSTQPDDDVGCCTCLMDDDYMINASLKNTPLKNVEVDDCKRYKIDGMWTV